MPRSRPDCHLLSTMRLPKPFFWGASCLQNPFHTHEPSYYPVNNPRRAAWLRVNKKEIENLRDRKKKRSKQLLQRRVKRARQRVGNRHSDQAKRNRKAVLCRRLYVFVLGSADWFILPRPPGEILSAEQVTSNEPSNDELVVRSARH